MAQRKQVLLRLPPDLVEEMNRWAKDDLRSLNAQIEWVLRGSLRKRRKLELPEEETDDE
ncbi:MAG TPA: Arc family DNA binding domain-containing protein [Candidatus Hydrogenedentes bacterium]|nr:Arc family DNA binding domain-containing protein [Candidatus Hydrogenedentota bacterium]